MVRIEREELGVASPDGDAALAPYGLSPSGSQAEPPAANAGRTALEQSFADLAARHNLSSLSVTFMAEGRQRYWVSAQWSDDAAPNGLGCEHGHGDGTLASALTEALSKAAASRSITTTLADEPLPVEAA